MIRIVLPFHLRNLAGLGEEDALLEISEPVTVNRIVDALETRYPPLRGTIRDFRTGRRRQLVRFFACGEDLSNQELDTPLPLAVAEGKEPLIILGAIAGG